MSADQKTHVIIDRSDLILKCDFSKAFVEPEKVSGVSWTVRFQYRIVNLKIP